MPDSTSKLPAKLDELHDLFNEVGLGWLFKAVVRLCINKLGFVRIAEKLAECADAAVDDYFTSRAAEWSGLEGKFRTMAKDWVQQTAASVDKWANL